MGFGILFIGHILLFFFRGVDIFPDIFAYLMIFYAVCKLASYNVGFAHAKITLIPLMAVSSVNDVVQIISAVRGTDFGIFSLLLTVLSSIGMLAMYWFLTNGVYLIAKDVGRQKIAVSARRNIVLTAVYSTVMLVYKMDFPFMQDIVRYLGIIFLMLGFAWVIFNATMFFSCYMWICLEGDEDMPDNDRGFFRKLSHPPADTVKKQADEQTVIDKLPKNNHKHGK